MYDVMIPVTLQRYQTDQKYIYIIQIRFEKPYKFFRFWSQKESNKEN